MFTHLQRHSKIRRGSSLIAGLVLALLLLPLLSATSAFAQAVPGGPSKDNPFCFSTTEGALPGDPAIPASYCYPTLAACNGAVGSHTDVDPPCHDAYAAMSDFEKTVQTKGAWAAAKEKVSNWAGDAAMAIVGTALEWIAHALAEISGKIMIWMGDILDMAIDRTINSATYSNLKVVNVGWTAVRDLSNMFFIFVLLYIAILTVLGQAGSSAKRWVVNLVIAALLINFSLFFTKVVIDAGNALSIGIWNNLKEKQSGVTVNGVSMHFSEAFRVQTSFDTLGNDPTGTPYPQPDALHRAMIYFGATLVQCIAAYLFLAGAIMMIIRTVTLLIVMMVSPFAFLGFALPKGGGFASEWLSKLIGATFVAPVFIFMLYLNSIIIHTPDINSLGGGQDAKWALAIEGNPASFAIMYQFAIMCIMLLASMTVAQKVGNGVGSSAGSLAKKSMGYGAAAGIGATAWGMRRSVGFASDKMKNSKGLQEASQRQGMRGMLARTALRTANVGAKSSFDLRAAPGMGVLAKTTGVNFGAAGGAGGERARRQTQDKAIMAKAEELFPNNPAAQENYIRNATRVIPGVGTSRYDKKTGEFASKEDKALKDKKTAIEREKVTVQAKKHLSEQAELMSTMTPAQRSARLAEDITFTDETGATITKKVSEVMAESVAKLNAKEVSELSEKVLANEHVQNSLTNSQLAAIQAKATEFKDQTLIPKMTRNVLDNGTESGKRYMRAQVSSGASNFSYDYKTEITQQQAAYDAAVAAGDIAKRDAAADAIKTVVERVDAKDIAGLDVKELKHETIVRNMKSSHVGAVQKRDDLDETAVQDFHDAMNTHSSDIQAQGVMSKALKNPQSNLFSAVVAQTRLDEINGVGGAAGTLALAQADYSAASSPGSGVSASDLRMKMATVKKIEAEQKGLEKALA